MLNIDSDTKKNTWSDFIVKQIFLFNNEIEKEDKDYRSLIASGIVLCLMLFALSFFSLYNLIDNPSLACFDFSIVLIEIGIYFIFRKIRNVPIISGTTALFMFLATIIPIYMAESKDFIPLWAFLYPFAAMMLLGHKKGLICTSIGFLLIYVVVFDAVGSNITLPEYVRYVLISLIVIAFSYLYEYTVHIAFLRVNNSIVAINNLNSELEAISRTDSLTTLYNRRFFDEIFSEQIKIAKRNNNLLIFLMIDIDFFKQYNDIYGHQNGDTALKEVALVIKKTLDRPGDYCFRLGGEEFGMLFTTKNKQGGLDIANAVRKEVESLKITHRGNLAAESITVSIGVSTINPEIDISTAEIYKMADNALYKAKQNGRNQVEQANLC